MPIDNLDVNQGGIVDPADPSIAQQQSQQDEKSLLAERVKLLEEQNKKLEDDNTNYKTALKAFKGNKSDRGISPEKQSPEIRDAVQNDDEDEYTKDQRKLVQEELARRESQRHDETLKSALRVFVEKYPQYSPENDINDINWKKIEPLIKRHAFMGDKEDMLHEIEILHRGITQPLKPTILEPKTEVEDSGIGSVPPAPKGKDKQPDAMTRPLNKYEQAAAKVYSGGEKAYREALAKRENSGK